MSLVDLRQGRNNNLHNLRYYVNAAVGAIEFLGNNRERQKAKYLLRPLDEYVVNPLTNIVTDKIALPVLKSLYYVLGKSTVLTVSCVSSSKAKKIEDVMYDPLSTDTLLRLGNRIQKLSLGWSKRSPVQVSIIEYADTCSIVAARHIYIFTSDMITLLHMPTKLRLFADEVCVAADEEIIQPLVRDGDEYGRTIVQNSKDNQLTIKDASSTKLKEIHDFENVEVLEDSPLEKTEESSQQGVWGFLNSIKSNVKYYATAAVGYATSATSKLGGYAARLALGKVRKHAYDVINQNEKKVRQKIVGKAVHSVFRTVLVTCVRGVVRSVEVVACEQMMEHVFVAIMPNSRAMARTTSLCITVAGTVLWLKCLSPTASRLNHSYNANFDSKSSTLRELASLVGQQNIDQLVGKVKNDLNPYIPANSYLGNFTRRVAGIQVHVEFENFSNSSNLNAEWGQPIIEDVESDGVLN